MTPLWREESNIKTGEKRTRGDEGCAQARRLLTRWGAAPLLYFALLPDKQYLNDGAENPRWSIAYRKIGPHVLALGDPLGDPNAAPEAITAFLRYCRQNRRRPAFYQVTPEHLASYRAVGLQSVKVGEEARIALHEFSLAGKRFKNLRNDLRRIEKAGIFLEEFGAGQPPNAETLRDMAAICESWRRAHRASEGSFAMGGFDPQSALFEDSRILAARDSGSGRLLAFATFVPAFGPGEPNGWTLDLMRRRADALHGVMDFLIVSAAQRFTEEGAEILSLGLSPLSGGDAANESPQIALVRRFLYRRMGRVYNFQGLHTFKAKFATHWEARYLVTRPGIGLAATAGAILKAHRDSGQPRVFRRPPLRRRGLALATLLLLLLSPFEKTLAKRAVTQPRRWAHFHALHFPQRLRHFPPARTWGRQSPPGERLA